MFKNLPQLYCLIVCSISSIMMIIGIENILSKSTDYTLTEYKYARELGADRENFIREVKAVAISDIFGYITWLITGLIFFTTHWIMSKLYIQTNV